MKISVIIPTRNRDILLKNTLESISVQTLDQREFEVIVVDNGSIDGTKEIVKSFYSKILNLTYIYDPTPGLHVGRHRGLMAAKSDILVYADDDIEALPNWLDGIFESFENYGAVLVGGRNLPKFEETPPSWILKMWEKNKVVPYLSILDLGDEIKEIEPHYVFGCNFSINRKVLLEAGGFHPDGMPEELIKYRGDGETHVSDYIKVKGYKTIYNPKVCVYHYVSKKRMTKEYFRKRAFLQGISDSYTDIRNNKRRNLIFSQIKILIKSVFFNEDILIYESCLSGYKWHQKQAKKDHKLLDWIKRESYIEDGRI